MKRDFGSYRKLPSGRWQVRWTDPDTGERHKAPETFRTRGEAEEFLALVRTGAIDPLKGKRTEAAERTVGAVVEDMLRIEGPGLRSSTLAGYKGLLRNQIGYIHDPQTAEQKRNVKEGIAFVSVFALTREDVRDWLARLRDRGCSWSNQRKAFILLRKALAELIENDILERDPCAGLGKKRALWAQKPEPKHVYLEPAEVDKVRRAFAEEYQALVEVLAWGGLRIGEAFALTPDDVIFRGNHASLLVSKSQSEVGGEVRIERPKNRRSRKVSLGEESARILREHIEKHVKPGDERLFVTPQRRRPLRYNNFRDRIWNDAVREAGFPTLRPHDLRSTCATNLFALGWEVKEVQKHLGHATAQITLDIYTEFRESGRNESVSKIDAARRAAPDEEDAA